MIQILMNEPNINWKMLKIANEHHKEQNPDAPSLLEMRSCGLYVLHGAYKTAQSVISWKLDRFLKNCFSISKKSSARRSVYLKFNDLFVSHEGKDTSCLFPLKDCRHRWLENGKAIGRIIEILPYIK